jgi:hypothetical protein
MKKVLIVGGIGFLVYWFFIRNKAKGNRPETSLNLNAPPVVSGRRNVGVLREEFLSKIRENTGNNSLV